MKPQQPDIDWCLANRELVMRWLEKRGGWQEGDWYKDRHYEEPCLLGSSRDVALHIAGRGSEWAVWLPTSDDVLEMLEAEGVDDVRILTTVHVPGRPGAESYLAICDPLDTCLPRAYGETRLIALMELLKSVEEVAMNPRDAKGPLSFEQLVWLSEHRPIEEG